MLYWMSETLAEFAHQIEHVPLSNNCQKRGEIKFQNKGISTKNLNFSCLRCFNKLNENRLIPIPIPIPNPSGPLNPRIRVQKDLVWLRSLQFLSLWKSAESTRGAPKNNANRVTVRRKKMSVVCKEMTPVEKHSIAQRMSKLGVSV